MKYFTDAKNYGHSAGQWWSTPGLPGAFEITITRVGAPMSNAEQMRTLALLRGLYYYDRRLVARVKRAHKKGASVSGLAMERADLLLTAKELLEPAPQEKAFAPFRRYFK